MSGLVPAEEPPVAPPEAAWWRSFGRNHWWVFALTSLAWLFDCLCQQVFNLARGGAVEQLVHDPARVTEFGTYTNSFLLIGWATGGLIFGALGDRFGRARVLCGTLLLYSVGTALSAFATSYLFFCASVTFTGLGIGGVFGLSVALLADSIPDRSRPAALGLLQSLSSWGNLLAGAVGLGVSALAARGALPFGLHYWQSMFLIGAAPAFACVFLLRRLPEPERWVRAKREGAVRGIKFGSYDRLLRHPVWSRHAWLGLLFCCSGIVGLWSIGNFHPTIVSSIVTGEFEARHLTAEQLSAAKAKWTSIALFLQNIGAFLGMISFARLAQVKGRKFALALGLVLSFLTSITVLLFLRHLSQIYWMLPLMGYGQFTVFGVYAIYLPELFPTSLRSTGVSFCYNFGRLAAATAPFTMGRLTKSLGGNIAGFRTAGMWVSLVLLVGLVAVPFLPETKGLPLPEE